IVDQEPNRAEVCRDVVDDGVDLVPVTGVEGIADHGRLRVVGGDGGGHLAGPPLVDIGNHDRGAAGGEPAGYRLADPPAGGGRHEGDPSGEFGVVDRN